jgi:hypothetical protein
MSSKNLWQTCLPPTLHHKAPFAYECMRTPRRECLAGGRGLPLRSPRHAQPMWTTWACAVRPRRRVLGKCVCWLSAVAVLQRRSWAVAGVIVFSEAKPSRLSRRRCHTTSPPAQARPPQRQAALSPSPCAPGVSRYLKEVRLSVALVMKPLFSSRCLSLMRHPHDPRAPPRSARPVGHARHADIGLHPCEAVCTSRASAQCERVPQ